MKKFWEFKAAEKGVGELYLYGEIVSDAYRWYESDISANSFKKDLDALGDINTLNIYINSPGGSVFEGVAIYNILKRHKAYKNVHVDGLAASIASVIAMAGDTIHMPRNSMMMIHNPWTLAIGNAAELRKVADDLERIGESMKQSYLEKAGDKLDEAKLTELLDAETWLSAQECYEYGLCDVVGEEKQIAACISDELMARYKNVPESLRNSQRQQVAKSSEEELRRKIIAESMSNLEYLKTILGGI